EAEGLHIDVFVVDDLFSKQLGLLALLLRAELRQEESSHCTIASHRDGNYHAGADSCSRNDRQTVAESRQHVDEKKTSVPGLPLLPALSLVELLHGVGAGAEKLAAGVTTAYLAKRKFSRIPFPLNCDVVIRAVAINV